MALSPQSALLPAGRIAPDLLPRTPEEVKAFRADAAGYADNTEKTAAYVTAWAALGDTEAAAADLSGADADRAALLYVYARAFETAADHWRGMAEAGSVDKEGSYRAESLAKARAYQALADGYAVDLGTALATPSAQDKAWPSYHRNR